ncbi:MAG: bifunctional phosphoglucose/phosphomannose isomerase [Candidatus Omnitrophota bacterium]
MRSLDDPRYIERIDRLKMREIIGAFSQQCTQAFALGKHVSPGRALAKVRNSVCCGMGGSAIGAEIMSGYLRKDLRIPLAVNRDYTLPGYVGKETLAILMSYSGNTEEVLGAYQQARSKKAKIIALTCGGELAEAAKKNGDLCVLLPQGYPPRSALAFLSLPLLAIFANIGLIKNKEQEVRETVKLLKKLEKEAFGVAVPSERNPAKTLAHRLKDHYCVIYAADEHFSAVATRWRQQLAENSKMLSSTHVFPEMTHNEIVGWRHPRSALERFVVVFLRDPGEHPQVKKRIDITRELLQKESITLKEIWSRGDGLLARMFSLIYKGDFVSYYLALLNEEDPLPVERIDYLKKQLKERR